jgi:hypothetical protein
MEKLEEKILTLLETKETFRQRLRILLKFPEEEEIVTKSYFNEQLVLLTQNFDEKLAKLSKEFDDKLAKLSREFDDKLAKLSKEFDEKLAKLSREFDDKLAKLSKEFDEKLRASNLDLKKYISDRFAAIGSRWGIEMENTIRLGIKELFSGLGYEVMKWQYNDYDIDIVIKDKKHILLQISASCSHWDIKGFEETAEEYRKRHNVEIQKKIFLTPNPTQKAIEKSKEFGISIISPFEEIKI